MSDKEQFKAYVAVYLVLIKDGKILLLRRKDTGYQDGNYGLVSGHLDGDETSKKAIAREALEEAGITIKPKNLEVAHVMHYWRTDREYISIFLRTEEWEGEVCNMEEHKCDDLSWFNLKGLPENMVPEIKNVLKEIDNGNFYSEFGW